jgi:hypothetical protein
MKPAKSTKAGRPSTSVAAYDSAQPAAEASVCRRLRTEIERALPDATSKVWHGAPVWFVGDTPVVGYSVPARGGVTLLFWNGQAFGDPALNPVGKFKAAQIRFGSPAEIQLPALRRWLRKAGTELWDFSSLRPRKPARSATRTKSPPKADARAGPGASQSGGAVKLLSGGNPQVAKADGEAPVRAYIAAMPGWKREIGESLDALVARTVPGVRKAVKWNSPFYGVEGRGWFLSFHCFTKYVKVTFFRGASLRPVPPGPSKDKNVRYLDIHEGDEFDEARLADWVKQAAALSGWAP